MIWGKLAIDEPFSSSPASDSNLSASNLPIMPLAKLDLATRLAEIFKVPGAPGKL